MRWLPLLLVQSRRLGKGIGDHGTAVWSEAVVVEFEYLEATVMREEGDNLLDTSRPECIVAQVELDE